MRLTLSSPLWVLCFLPLISQAESKIPKPTIANTLQQTSEIVFSHQERASRWGLDDAEWARFEELMQGPLGLHSPNLDPLSALGIEARTDTERQRYAELQVQMETARISKLLAYQNAYDRAFKRLYPDVLPVNLVGTATQASPVIANERPSVFVTSDCKRCEETVRRMQSSAQPFDIYLMDSRSSDDLIRAWARKVGIAPDKVRSRQITLNHDDGRWARLGDQGGFPAVLRQHNGTWVRQ